MSGVYGKFTAESELGHGGMGITYRARHADTGEIVALKVLPAFLAKDALFKERFLRESANLKRLDHPGIVRLIGSGEENGVHYYAMELLEGESLQGRIMREPISEYDAVEITKQLLRALEFAHTALDGTIHRDLKPENVILVTGNPKIIDFGLSKMVMDATLTVTGSNFGSPAYMSPEQFDDAKGVDHRADLWAVGMILYYCVTGSMPFQSDTSIAILRKLNDPGYEIPSARSVKPELLEWTDQILTRALNRDSSLRFQTAREFLDALEGADHQPRVKNYELSGDFELSTYVAHPVFNESGLIVGRGRTEEGLEFIAAEFPSKGRLKLVVNQGKAA